MDVLAANRLGHALNSEMSMSPRRPANTARFENGRIVTRLSAVVSSVRKTRLNALRFGVVGWLWLLAVSLGAVLLGLHLTS
jgi:hypothetical protein